MTNLPLSKIYDPQASEQRWYNFWEKQGLFKAGLNSQKPSFSIVIPPPNITGSLHIGHALNNTLQDIVIRYKRMDGYNTLWMFGTDHAGIATQNVVERQLAAEGINRQHLGREAFMERVWNWRSQSGDTITKQLKLLGASCDWGRERFTLDEGLSRSVRQVFVRLYQEGLIYRGNYMINWCPRCHTALSDLEVEHEERDGFLYYIRYPLAVEGKESATDYLTVATTRPETMLGDTAVAVNPEDARYQKWVGQRVMLPLCRREIPIIADSYVDPAFGTGSLKVTPAHDPNDFELGQRHQLEQISVMNPDGSMSPAAGAYQGLSREECRKKLVADLERQGYLEKKEPYRHAVGHCYRCKTAVEPTISQQWFLKTKQLAEPAIEVVRSGRVKLIPAHWEATYFDWMLNIHDWCISRQIWWGHRIPAWYCRDCEKISVSVDDIQACQHCGSRNLKAETDVLDTWFSSALWPFSTMGWPDETPELKFFYPTSVLVTSFDILFFWVARMIMMGLKFMGEVPFHRVYMHALVRDAEGHKMSKSRGNVVDPLIMMDKYGTDAFRFTLTALTSQGRDICLDEKRLVGYRNFINKIWNAARFSLANLDDFTAGQLPAEKLEYSLADKWILSRLQRVIAQANTALEEYRFNDLAGQLYHFFWHEFCDWYLELIKLRLADPSTPKAQRYSTQLTLLRVLEQNLRLLHPIIPFITEEIWQRLPKEGEEVSSIMLAPWPRVDETLLNQESESSMELLQEVVITIRTLRSELNLPPGKVLPQVLLSVNDSTSRQILQTQETYIRHLAKVSQVTIGTQLSKPADCAGGVTKHGSDVFIPLAALLDLEQESQRLEKIIQQEQKKLKRVESKLTNPDFLEKAPEHVVSKERQKQAQLVEKIAKLQTNLAGMRK